MRAGLVVTGFPRSGTTLLYCMLRYADMAYRYFDKEKHRLERGSVIKYPRGVFGPGSGADCIVTIRDPRGILTSLHPSPKFRGKGYFVSAHSCANDPKRGLVEWWDAIKAKPQAVVVRYENLVAAPEQVQAELTARFPFRFVRPFSTFHEAQTYGQMFDTAMHGVRPLAGRDWSEKQQRIDEQFSEYPQLRDVMREMGYSM